MSGVLPFCAIGLFVGSLVGAQGAPAVVNMIYLPMAFLAGLWMPLSMLPPQPGCVQVPAVVVTAAAPARRGPGSPAVARRVAS